MDSLLRSEEELRKLLKLLDEAQYKCLEKYAPKEDDEVPSTFTAIILDSVIMDIKCFVHCVFEEAGLMDGTQLNTTLFDDWLLFEASMEDKQFLDISSMRKCVEDVADDDDKCGKAFDYYMCLGTQFFDKYLGINLEK
ncbi:Hypothetical protein NTJ_13653 [Nesidiocoris tenuis]|uniref:Uncharacterized protein n=1 Tax=Nesidiocoris tenuis TaxID=355587 RepID=A0ABN7B8Y1_9HEMI|nr:Hypothetical protein NTJ_13653 [Nesidiocoris tenuis]